MSKPNRDRARAAKEGVTGRNGRILTSTDAVTWKPSPSGMTVYFQSAAFGNNTFVAGGSRGIVVSTNGTNWSYQFAPFTPNEEVEEIVFAGGVFLLVGNSGTLATSLDGITWTARRRITNESLRGAVYADGRFLVVGNNDIILESADFRPRLRGANAGNDRGFELILEAEFGLVHHLQVSTDLRNWAPLVLLTNSGPSVLFVDSPTASHPRRFYRVIRQD